MLVRAVAVALIATLCSGLPMAVLLTDPASNFSATGGYLLIALVGNLILGLPVSLLAFHLVTVKSLTLSSLLMIANVVGFALVIVVTALGGAFATIFFGIPILLAANAFAFGGWFIVVKPAQDLT